MKKLLITLFIVSIFIGTSCQKDTPAPANTEQKGDDEEIPDGISGDLSLITLEKGNTYTVVGDLNVPQGKSVTIPEGVRFEFVLGSKNEAWTIDVFGSLYVEGTATQRVVFTAAQSALASNRNIGYGGLWGGIIGTTTTGDIVIEYADILHAGGIARSGTAITSPATGGSGRLTAGDRGYALFFCRPDGNRQDGVFILKNSRIAYTPDDAIRTNGGKTLMAYNVFEVVGQTGGEAVNIKAGGSGDFAFNLFYNIATNGLKSADTQSGVRGNLNTNFYNNTIVNSGFRRSEAGRGGSLNFESDAFGKAYNNLIVNSRYGLRLTAGEDKPNTSKLSFGYNWYYGKTIEITENFYPTTGASQGLIGTELSIPATDVIGTAGANDPQFVNYDVAAFNYAERSNANGIPAGANFHLKSSSTAKSGAYTSFTPVFNEYKTLTGKTYNAPEPAAYYGAYPEATN